MGIWIGATIKVIWPVAKILLVLSALSVMLFLILYYGGIIMAMVACIVGLVFTISFETAMSKFKTELARLHKSL